MNYHFILEGPDGVGKSTLARKLSRVFDIPIIRLDVGRLENIEIASKTFNKTITQFKNYPFILDRWFISSMVYAKVYNRADDLSYIDSFKKLLPNSYLIYMNAPINVLLERKDDELISPDKLKVICEEYDRLITPEFSLQYFDKLIKVDTSKEDQFYRVMEELKNG